MNREYTEVEREIINLITSKVHFCPDAFFQGKTSMSINEIQERTGELLDEALVVHLKGLIPEDETGGAIEAKPPKKKEHSQKVRDAAVYFFLGERQERRKIVELLEQHHNVNVSYSRVCQWIKEGTAEVEAHAMEIIIDDKDGDRRLFHEDGRLMLNALQKTLVEQTGHVVHIDNLNKWVTKFAISGAVESVNEDDLHEKIREVNPLATMSKNDAESLIKAEMAEEEQMKEESSKNDDEPQDLTHETGVGWKPVESIDEGPKLLDIRPELPGEPGVSPDGPGESGGELTPPDGWVENQSDNPDYQSALKEAEEDEDVPF